MATAQKSSNPTSNDSNLVPFEKAVKVKLVEGTNDTFSATLTSDWCNIANIGFGGLCVSLMLAASRAYFATTHPSRSQPDPIHVTAQFLSAVPAGPLTIQVQPEKLGHNYSVVRVSLRTATTICTVAFVTQGNLATESGPNFETPKFELPDRAKCREVISKVFGTANPATKRCRIFCPPGGETPFWTPYLGRHRRDQWARLTDDDSRWDLLSLACIADWIPAMPLNYGYDKDMMGFLKTYGQSTISLTMEIRKDPKGAQWLLQRAVMNAAKNGRFDLDVKIIESLSVVRTVFTFTVSEDDILSSLCRVLLWRKDSLEVGRLGLGREQPQNPLGAYRPEWQRVLGDDRGKSLDCRHYSERAIVEQRIKDSCEEMADKIEEHVAVLDSNLAAQRRYHRLFKHLRQLASDEDDARE
ncbi:hypothetical protein V501_01484 [Pseudogymnoascus sp. VKM F-4519 (FW-2642)]|nr:hypothetical protein V501_01484 [Pseudogymnoascus sp. VKM F-4519 (FW-2642)]